MKILNLYAGIGGNRKLWGDEHEITAVENNMQIAQVYMELYPNDKMIIGDAHDFLLHNYMNFDFIWTSPPCQTHSRMRQHLQVGCRGQKAKFPDMKLYEEIIFLQSNFKGNYVVENVKPYYEPLVKPNFELQRHLYWSDIEVEEIEFKKSKLRSAQIEDLQEYIGIDLSGFRISNKRQALRNCVLPEIGKYIFKAVEINDVLGNE